jgi:hypothetical protein
MPEQPQQMRPASKELAPDPATSYERAKPEKEAGMGRMDNDVATPTDSPDRMEQAVTHKQPSDRQLNADEIGNGRSARPADGSRLKSRD